MNYRHPPVQKPAPLSEYEYAAAEDSRLQADPELAASEGPASPLLIAVYFAAMVFFICLVIYGINNSRDETAEMTASPPAAQAPNTAAAPPAPQQQPNPQQGSQGGPNPPPVQKQAQPQQNPPPAQQQAKPANGQQPNAQQSGQPPAQQQQAPAAQQAPAPKQ